MRRQECGSNAMVTVQMTVEEYLEMKSWQDAKEVPVKQKNLVYGLEGLRPSSAAARPRRGESRTANGSVRQSVR